MADMLCGNRSSSAKEMDGFRRLAVSWDRRTEFYNASISFGLTCWRRLKKGQIMIGFRPLSIPLSSRSTFQRDCPNRIYFCTPLRLWYH